LDRQGEFADFIQKQSAVVGHQSVRPCGGPGESPRAQSLSSKVSGRAARLPPKGRLPGAIPVKLEPQLFAGTGFPKSNTVASEGATISKVENLSDNGLNLNQKN
jgi:hypothetical protein